MPPTFLLFFLILIYLAMVLIASAIGSMLILNKKSATQGKVLILTVLISLPILLIIGATLAAIFFIPGAAFAYLAQLLHAEAIVLVPFAAFVLMVIFFALYHWRIGYMLIRNYFKKHSIHRGIEHDVVYKLFLKHLVTRLGFK